jgi:hypothetical protein
MFKQDGNGFAGAFVFEGEFSFGTEAEGGDGRIASDHFFIVTVPAHAFVAGMV